MHLTDNTELTDAQTRDLVRRGVAKGRRMNATRRAVSGVAALAVVGALSVGAFNVVGALSPDNNVAPAAPAPMAPKEAPPASDAPSDRVDGEKVPQLERVEDRKAGEASERPEDPNPPVPNMSTSQKLKAALKELLPGAKRPRKSNGAAIFNIDSFHYKKQTIKQ